MSDVITIHIPAWVFAVFLTSGVLQCGLWIYKMYLQRKLDRLKSQRANT